MSADSDIRVISQEPKYVQNVEWKDPFAKTTLFLDTFIARTMVVQILKMTFTAWELSLW